MGGFHRPTLVTTVVAVLVILVAYHFLAKRSSRGE